MKHLQIKIRVPLQPFLDRAEKIKKENNYPDDVIEIAKHQSVIWQDAAFDKATSLLSGKPGVNVSVEPIEVEGDKVVYMADYIAMDKPYQEALLNIFNQTKKEDIIYQK